MSWQQTIQNAVAATLFTGAASVAVVNAARADDLVITGPGGETAKKWVDIVYGPFSDQTGNSVTPVFLGGDEALAKAIAEVKSPSIDILQFPGGQETEMVKRDLAQSVGDLKGTGIKPDFVGPNSQWIGAFATLNGIIYNTKYVKPPPASIMDLAKPEYAGKVGIPPMNNAKGISLLLSLAKANGGHESDAAPGLKALGQIMKNGAKIYTKATQLQSMFAQKEIWITYYDLNNAILASDNGLPVAFTPPKEGMTLSITAFAIAKNTQKADAARKLLAYMLKPEVQKDFAEKLISFPAIEGASMPDALLKRANIKPEDLKNILHSDSEIIAKNRPGWLDEFNKLAAQ